MRASLRHRLLTVALLSAISCAISLVALARIISSSAAGRLERARDAVTAEISALCKAGPAADPGLPTLLGMHGGFVREGTNVVELRPEIDAAALAVLRRVIRDAAASHDAARGEIELGDDTFLVAASPATQGSIAWVSYAVRPPTFALFWRTIVASLTIATLLLIATTLNAVVSVQRGARALKASLAAIGSDLSAPVTRPPLRELADVADGIAGLARDLAHAQEEKERLGAELARRERLAALGRVAAGVAHEVRNPLASIKLRVDLGRQRQDVPPQLARELGSVSEEITRLDRLVADLLVVAGRRSGPRKPAALGPLVRHRVALLEPWADERRVKIEIEGEARAELDTDAVARAIDNLVRNAVEASPAGAVVGIEIEDGRGGACIRVIDRGEGVDPARAHELFEPFFTTKPEGTGLGLALSRAIAMAHEGSLTYERRAGATSFELCFPPASGRDALAPRPPAPPKHEEALG